MKKVIAITVIVSLIIFNTAQLSSLYAEDEVVERISTIERAQEIAKKAEGEYLDAGTYWENPPAQTAEGAEIIALPVQDEKTGDVLGYIVAERGKLIAALNSFGLTEAANALAATEAGEVAGGAASEGIFNGTTVKVVLVVAVVAGIGFAVGGGGGGGGGGGSTSNHP